MDSTFFTFNNKLYRQNFGTLLCLSSLRI